MTCCLEFDRGMEAMEYVGDGVLIYAEKRHAVSYEIRSSEGHGIASLSGELSADPRVAVEATMARSGETVLELSDGRSAPVIIGNYKVGAFRLPVTVNGPFR